jgi:hypothetical protein
LEGTPERLNETFMFPPIVLGPMVLALAVLALTVLAGMVELRKTTSKLDGLMIASFSTRHDEHLWGLCCDIC